MLMALRRAGQWRIAEAAVLSLLHIPAFQECWDEVNEMASRESQQGDQLLAILRGICRQRFAALRGLDLEGVTFGVNGSGEQQRSIAAVNRSGQ